MMATQRNATQRIFRVVLAVTASLQSMHRNWNAPVSQPASKHSTWTFFQSCIISRKTFGSQTKCNRNYGCAWLLIYAVGTDGFSFVSCNLGVDLFVMLSPCITLYAWLCECFGHLSLTSSLRMWTRETIIPDEFVLNVTRLSAMPVFNEY